MSKFGVAVIIRIILILLLGFGAIYVITFTPYWLIFCWLVLFVFVGIIELLYFIDRTNRDLSNFLLAIRQNDFSNVYPENAKNRPGLYHAFNVITSEFMKLRNEKESNYQFLKTVVEHSGIPILAVNETGNIVLANEALKELLDIPHITKLESLNRISGLLYKAVSELESDEKALVKVEVNKELIHLSVQAKELFLMQEKHKIVAFHNINSELDQNEIESWQKLIRVLTHEIKNSVIPISTLSEVINQMLKGEESEHISLSSLNEEDEEDLKSAVNTIEKRSKGLVRFVTSYGDLAKVPKPKPENCDVKHMINQIVKLESVVAARQNIKIKTQLPDEKCYFDLDSQLIEQVLINLIKNGIEAMNEQGEGELTIALQPLSRGLHIEISDTGPGMDKETMENIFVPFFTTKKDGSGIGLSLSRQIIRSHGGSLKVRSTPGKGTAFEILL